jgi:endonuclease/exonuclease/phosphatase family metal-dependent hydrolase
MQAPTPHPQLPTPSRGTVFASWPCMPLHVMTYNIKGHGALLRPRHIERIAEVIRELKPDIVGVQEMHRGTWKVRFRDQAAELERLTGMQLFFGRAMGDGSSEYGNALLTRGAIVDTRIDPLPGKGEPRSMLGATIEVDGVRLIAYVTHLAAWARFGSRTRLVQAEAVAKLVAKSELPFVLMGDFNTSPASDELRVFHDGSLVTSCFVEKIVTHRATKQCLDYIFTGPTWTIRDAKVIARGPSDHWPLLAAIERSG